LLWIAGANATVANKAVSAQATNNPRRPASQVIDLAEREGNGSLEAAGCSFVMVSMASALYCLGRRHHIRHKDWFDDCGCLPRVGFLVQSSANGRGRRDYTLT
jgi:hypothetical protein